MILKNFLTIGAIQKQKELTKEVTSSLPHRCALLTFPNMDDS